MVQGLEENLRESQATAQRLETHLKQKEKLYEDKIKVRFRSISMLTLTPDLQDEQQLIMHQKHVQRSPSLQGERRC